ncbi:hypothetical protein PJ985_14025 [Streptomyces sp. ACA25]|uniref:hypothetical protein n=1 Tax=Streptomyces sp. ACA25 TaxID=3022596 RepID=UPI002307B822|nr:hypothetical protein [Streptomyces sp. ACA25]MDB1088686.1 hypothetical protein [Streptomyces sp. ACA25]
MSEKGPGGAPAAGPPPARPGGLQGAAPAGPGPGQAGGPAGAAPDGGGAGAEGEGGGAHGAGPAGSAEGSRFAAARSGPGAAEDAAYAVRQSRANYASVQGDYASVQGDYARVDSERVGSVHFGDVHQYSRPAGPGLVSGTLPRAELRQLRRIFAPPPQYRELLDHLRELRVLALCGDPGTGRGCAAASLLDEVARVTVARLDARTEIETITEESLERERGYFLELAESEAVGGLRPEGPGEKEGGRWPAARTRPAELHLDRLHALLKERGSFLVLVVDAGDFAEELLRGRYGRLYLPPPTQSLLERHLTELLGHDGAEQQARAVATSARADVREALGLEQLRPHEAVTLAHLLSRHTAEELSDEELLQECRQFSHRQAASWFSGAGQAVGRRSASAALRPPAFRVALAVYNGEPYNVAAEAAETLAWELSTTQDPEKVPGRPLFTDNLQARLTASRAELGHRELVLGNGSLRLRTVRLQGSALSGAVLSQVWQQHHNARGPLCRWLRGQCDDPRGTVWVPAATAVAALCRMDYPYVLTHLLTPLARSESGMQRQAAATAVAEAARTPVLQPVMQSLVEEWGESEDAWLRDTAAQAHGFGTVEGSVPGSLNALGRLTTAAGRPTESWPAELAQVSGSVARLAAGTGTPAVLRRIGQWTGDHRLIRRNLALLSIYRLLTNPTWTLWGLEEQPHLAPYRYWPLAGALMGSRPELMRPLADLVWQGLDTARVRQVMADGLGAWMRQSDGDSGRMDVLCAFLPLLVSGEEDGRRIEHVVRGLERDPDEPVSAETVARLKAAVAPQRVG